MFSLIAGMAKRPMGFPTPNFVQGQVSASATGAPGGGATTQLQSNQGMTHTGKMSKELQMCGVVSVEMQLSM